MIHKRAAIRRIFKAGRKNTLWQSENTPRKKMAEFYESILLNSNNATMTEPRKKIKPLTTEELAALYSVTRKTLFSWLKPHKAAVGEKKSKYFTVMQVKTIFARIGSPESFFEEHNF